MRKKVKLSARGNVSGINRDDFIIRQCRPEAPPTPKQEEKNKNFFMGKKIYTKEMYEEYPSMCSVLKPRFKHLITAADEMNLQEKISVHSEVADCWEGDSESVYE